eukprot:284278-Chlamydomonas_euryale.AAC.1
MGACTNLFTSCMGQAPAHPRINMNNDGHLRRAAGKVGLRLRQWQDLRHARNQGGSSRRRGGYGAPFGPGPDPSENGHISTLLHPHALLPPGPGGAL